MFDGKGVICYLIRRFYIPENKVSRILLLQEYLDFRDLNASNIYKDEGEKIKFGMKILGFVIKVNGKIM